MSIFEQNLDPRAPSHVPLSPVSFLARLAQVHPNRAAVILDGRRLTYAEFLDRARRLASLLSWAGVPEGDTIAIIAPNPPRMLEAHYAVPMLDALLCSIRHDAVATDSSCCAPIEIPAS